jgi:23S rRNA (guanosine2251-2'-O)-methyltransferase
VRGLGGEQVEGRQAVRELLLAGRRRVREILVSEEPPEADPATGERSRTGRENESLQDIVDLALDLNVPVREVSRKRLAAEARTDAPQGVVAHAAPLDEVARDDLVAPTAAGRAASPPFRVAMDGVTDPGNLGALLRSAVGAGVTGCVLPRHRSVHVTPAVTKAAVGAVEHLPIALVGGLPTAITDLQKAGVWVIGLDAGGERAVFDLGLEPDQPVCLVLGAEGRGLSRLVRQRCDLLASIPLQGPIASLNVATAGAIACFEIARARHTAAG